MNNSKFAFFLLVIGYMFLLAAIAIWFMSWIIIFAGIGLPLFATGVLGLIVEYTGKV